MQNEIVVGIAQKLHNVFGDAYEIHIDSVRQDFREPCFFILPLQTAQRQIIGRRYYRESSFDVHYFPADTDPAEEISRMADRLFDVLEYIEVAGALVRGTGQHTESEDGVLHFFVNYNVFLLRELEKLPYMKKLEQKQGLKS